MGRLKECRHSCDFLIVCWKKTEKTKNRSWDWPLIVKDDSPVNREEMVCRE